MQLKFNHRKKKIFEAIGVPEDEYLRALYYMDDIINKVMKVSKRSKSVEIIYDALGNLDRAETAVIIEDILFKAVNAIKTSACKDLGIEQGEDEDSEVVLKKKDLDEVTEKVSKTIVEIISSSEKMPSPSEVMGKVIKNFASDDKVDLMLSMSVLIMQLLIATKRIADSVGGDE